FFAPPFDADFFAAPPARRSRYSSLRRFFSSASASHCSRERFGPSATSSRPSSLSVYSAQHCGQRMKSPRVLLLFFTTIFESLYRHSGGSGSSQLRQSQSGYRRQPQNDLPRRVSFSATSTIPHCGRVRPGIAFGVVYLQVG